MKNKTIKIYDSTLRDGAQTKGVSFSIDDKLRILDILMDIGVDYIEAGWPGANPIAFILHMYILSDKTFPSDAKLLTL